MDRKSFFRILPGLLLTKQIIKEFAQPPVIEGSKGIYWQMMNMQKNATVVDYAPQNFSLEMFYDIIRREAAKPRYLINYEEHNGHLYIVRRSLESII